MQETGAVASPAGSPAGAVAVGCRIWEGDFPVSGNQVCIYVAKFFVQEVRAIGIDS
jgi:hypothetical protein